MSPEKPNNHVINVLNSTGIKIPDILLPDNICCDYVKWSVVACDQYTSNKTYWKDVSDYVGDAPSSLRLILPEIYLADNFADRVGAIHEKMNEYLAGNVFKAPFNGFILTERVLHPGMSSGGGGDRGGSDGCKNKGREHSRWGLIIAIDLEKYSYEPGTKTLIRSSEKTVRDRLPPRTAIRRGAALELPHVLILADDVDHTIIEPLAEDAAAGLLDKAYDFELMAEGGHIRGYRIDAEGGPMRRVAGALGKLLRDALETYDAPFLFAVGDGNHSLAAAKAYWDEVKAKAKLLQATQDANNNVYENLYEKEKTIEYCAARYALVELVNLHSDAVLFEPIHRALYNTTPQTVLDELGNYFKGCNISFNANNTNDLVGAYGNQAVHGCDYQLIYDGGKTASLHVDVPFGEQAAHLPVAEIQGFIDYLCLTYPDISVDYIHGAGELKRLAVEEDCFCFALPPVDKNGFFAAIAANGTMPGKSFSMGEANDKRFYLEARKINERTNERTNE